MEALTELKATALAATSVAGSWSWASDFLIVFVLCGLLFLFAWYMGKGPFLGLILALYAGYALYAAFPYGSYLPTAPPIAALGANLAIYLGLTLVAYIVLRKAVVSDFITIGLIGLAILSFFGAGLVLALLYHAFPTREVYTFTPALDLLFAPPEYFFWWFIAPLFGLFFLAR